MSVTRTVNNRQKLIDTALELLWRNSYGSVSVDDICKAAGVQKGTFYHFFPSKIDLTLIVMEESSRMMRLKYDEIFSTGKKPLEAFSDMADFIYDSQRQTVEKYGHVCGCPCASLGSEIAAQEQRIRLKFEEISREQKQYYENAVKEMIAAKLIPSDVDAKVKADQIYAYMLGQMMVARIQNKLEPLHRDLKVGLMRTLGVESMLKAA